ncbi:AIR synthase family protein [Dethiothermospora halolimnae]|uniref:AIR synthase family protein n=1 Tax=Dethiothermospora halolimnae TaxID=3114390 RepID=UPI003CCBAB04
MKIGKLPNDVLEDIVLSNITEKRKEVLWGAGVGEDCAVLDFGKEACVMSTDPITGAIKNIGSLAVHISCNDVASNGAEPIGVLLTILVPPNTTKEDISEIMSDASDAANSLNVSIIGGHTEITDAVNKVVISATVVGKQLKEKILNPKNINIGDKVIITKMAGIEGTSIIAHDLEEKLKNKLTNEELTEAKNMDKYTSVVKEGKICGEIGVDYMHDVTEGGLLGAIWETSKAIDRGIKIKRDSIPVSPVTNKICNIFNIDPLKLISSGSMVIIASEEKVKLITKGLYNNNIKSTIIGEVIDKGIFMEDKGSLNEILPPKSDELYKVV